MKENDNDINPDSIFLNPEYLEQQSKQSEPPSDDDIRNFILAYGNELPASTQKYIEEYMSNPLNRMTDSPIIECIKDWIEHPERSKIYMDKIIYASTCPGNDDDYDESQSGKWKIEIPIIDISF